MADESTDYKWKFLQQLMIARYTLLQVIIAALITALGTVIAAYIMKCYPCSNHAQHWLHFDHVESADGGYHTNSIVHANISVNNANYVYPSKHAWIEMGPQMSRERFPLEAGFKSYQIGFQALISDPGGSVEEQSSQRVEPINVTSIPTEIRTYNLYPIKTDRNLSSQPKYKVFYSIQ